MTVDLCLFSPGKIIQTNRKETWKKIEFAVSGEKTPSERFKFNFSNFIRVKRREAQMCVAWSLAHGGTIFRWKKKRHRVSENRELKTSVERRKSLDFTGALDATGYYFTPQQVSHTVNKLTCCIYLITVETCLLTAGVQNIRLQI